jgi:hypothetical protein
VDHLLISPEIPGEFAGLSREVVTLIRHSRREKVALCVLERERALVAASAPQAVLDRIDEQIRRLDQSRVGMLGCIASLVPGYSLARQHAVCTFGFDPAVGTIRFNKRRGRCFTFGMPGQPVIAIWVQNGEVVRAEDPRRQRP